MSFVSYIKLTGQKWICTVYLIVGGMLSFYFGFEVSGES